MKRKLALALVLLFVLGTFSAIAAEAKDLSPWCTPPIALGKSKAEVEDTWGEPDSKKDAGTDETGLTKEVWIYRSKPLSDVLAKHSYVCNTFKLTFSGEALSGYEAVQDDEGKSNR